MTELEEHDVPAGVVMDRWEFRVTGAVAHALDIDRTDLADLPTESYTADFDCFEGWTAENLSWRGVRVSTLLERAEPTIASTHVLAHAMDGDYACGFRIDRISNALLALELDGGPLSVEHGGPARLVPTGAGADCWESLKWVSEMEVRESAPTADDTAEETALSRVG